MTACKSKLSRRAGGPGIDRRPSSGARRDAERRKSTRAPVGSPSVGGGQKAALASREPPGPASDASRTRQVCSTQTSTPATVGARDQAETAAFGDGFGDEAALRRIGDEAREGRRQAGGGGGARSFSVSSCTASVASPAQRHDGTITTNEPSTPAPRYHRPLPLNPRAQKRARGRSRQDTSASPTRPSFQAPQALRARISPGPRTRLGRRTPARARAPRRRRAARAPLSPPRRRTVVAARPTRGGARCPTAATPTMPMTTPPTTL